MDKELTHEEARLAWAQGKKVEARPRLSKAWTPVKPHTSCGGQYSADVLLDPSFIFQLSPEPPAKRYRPWAPEEVPLGAQIRAIGLIWRGLILAVCANGEIHCMTGFIPLEHAFANHEHSTDNGKTWLPCGVEVEVES